MNVPYDALMVIGFGGPEGPDDVLPFLQNVVRGRGVPDERLAEVAQHYHHFGGVSPLNNQVRSLLAALRPALADAGVTLPVYWGNRNWDPLLPDELERMRADGVQRALALVLSPFGSYSSCRQYLDDIERARLIVGPGAPVIDKLRHYHDHPGYIGPHADAVRLALSSLPASAAPTRLVFTAHSVPTIMDERSGPTGHRYTAQLGEAAALVAARGAPGIEWDLVWQSRSGPPQLPWLAPDINDHLVDLAAQGVGSVVVSPVGFISDHLEVLWDLDTEAAATAAKLGLEFRRAATPGEDPRFIAMVRDLFLERLTGLPQEALGILPRWDTCAPGCCALPTRPSSR